VSTHGPFECDEGDWVRLWRVADGTMLRRLDARGHSLALVAGGRYVASAGQTLELIRDPDGVGLDGYSKTYLVDQELGHSVLTLMGRGRRVGVSSDGKLWVTAQGSGDHLGGTISGGKAPIDCRLTLWESDTRKEVLMFNETGTRVCAFSPDGRQIASGGVD